MPAGTRFDNSNSIAPTEKRAFSLHHLGLIIAHIRKRLQPSNGEPGEKWTYTPNYSGAKEHTVTRAEDVTLYDFCECVIKLVTTKVRSMVEQMATTEQSPDYFVSHFWGESVIDFSSCLRQQARDRHLDEEHTCYWVRDVLPTNVIQTY